MQGVDEVETKKEALKRAYNYIRAKAQDEYYIVHYVNGVRHSFICQFPQLTTHAEAARAVMRCAVVEESANFFKPTHYQHESVYVFAI